MSDTKSSQSMGEKGQELLKGFEKFMTKLYDHDGGGHCTIGWGHLVHRGKCDGRENEAQFLKGITTVKADELLNDDLGKAVKQINRLVDDERLTLNQNQFDALVSFAYNTGSGSLKKMIDGTRDTKGQVQVDKITERMAKYNRAGGTISAGLTNRRNAEIDLFNEKMRTEAEIEATRIRSRTIVLPQAAPL